jgi:polyhydroxybutyrate depolymerase
LPVVFDFHGYQENAQIEEALSDLSAYGQTHGFVTITPSIDSQRLPQWQATAGSRDVAWIGDLLTHVEATTCIDENRVFATGISNGAHLASVVGCQYSSRIAAVAPVAGIFAPSQCEMTRPVPVITFHGTADPVAHYDGTPSLIQEGLPAPNGSKATLGQEARQLGDRDPLALDLHPLVKGPPFPKRRRPGPGAMAVRQR